jgi:hypothetical protein
MGIGSKYANVRHFLENGDLNSHNKRSTTPLCPAFVQPFGIKLKKSSPTELPVTTFFYQKIVITVNDTKLPHLSSGDGSPWI